MAIGGGSPLTPVLTAILGTPFVIRDRRVVMVALWAESGGATKAYLQFHNVADAAGVAVGRAPEYVVPLLVGGVTVLDGYHFGLEGLAFDTGLVLALSSTPLTYTAIAAATGSWVQLMVK
jgi:hypothetical protein